MSGEPRMTMVDGVARIAGRLPATQSGASTAELAAALRRFVDYYGTDPGVPMSAVDEAAAAAERLEQFNAIEGRLNAELATAYQKISDLNAENDRLRYSKAIG